MTTELVSERVEFEDAVEANEIMYQRGWTDGLPVIPPTERRIRDFLDYVKVGPDHVIAEYRGFDKAITAEKLAINAVMAGCRPEYMPILIAAVKAITTERYHLTHMVGQARWPLVIVNGPQVKELGFHSDFTVMGSGTRANATVGRAMSLLIWNCFTTQFKDALGQRVIGHVGRFNYCIGENEDTPWDPYHVQKGFDRNDNVVTVFPSAGHAFPAKIPEGGGGNAFKGSAEAWADALTRSFYERTLTFYTMGIGPVVQDVFVKEGWTKEDLRQYIFDHAKESVAQVKRNGRWQYFGTPDGLPPRIEPGDEETMVHLFKDRQQWLGKVWQVAELNRDPEILMVVGWRGGYGGGVTIIPSYNVGTQPVTVKVQPVA